MSRKDKPVCGCHAPRDGQEFSGRTLYAPACRRAPPPAARTHAVPAHSDPQPHVPFARRAHTVPARPVPQLLLAMRPAHVFLPAAETLPGHGDPQRHVLLARAQAQANPHHSRHCAPASAAETRQHRTRGRSGMMTPHWSRTTASHAGVIWHDHPTRAAGGYGFGSTSARRNARGARHAGIGHAAFDREVCSGAKLGEVTWRGVSGMGSLDLDR